MAPSAPPSTPAPAPATIPAPTGTGATPYGRAPMTGLEIFRKTNIMDI
jgi:hypothetical protein